MSDYIGLTYPKKLRQKWRKRLCESGHHLFDEVRSIDRHFLSCDFCGLMVDIAKIDPTHCRFVRYGKRQRKKP